jgi:RNA polymerase sigma factor (sigma-70 family)
MVGREAEDIVQEATATAFRDIAKFEGRSKFSTWLYGIALNLCRKHLRDKSRHASAASQEVLDGHPAKGRGVLSSVIRHEMAERLEISVGRLPTSCARPSCCATDGMDCPESSITEVSEARRGSRAFRRARCGRSWARWSTPVWLEKDKG